LTNNLSPNFFSDINPYVQHLQIAWPFLFELPWLQTHFQLLMGHLLDLPMKEYLIHHTDHMMTYLTSSGSTSTVKNIAINVKWEKNRKNLSLKMLILICMVANYFNEDFNIFIKTVEVSLVYLNPSWSTDFLFLNTYKCFHFFFLFSGNNKA